MKHPLRRPRVGPQFGLEMLEGRRLLAGAGSLDPGFALGYGSSAVPLDVPILAQFSVEARSMATLPDGKIVVSGPVAVEAAGESGTVLSVARFNGDGTPDTTFGSGGEVQLPIDGESPATYGTAVQPDGRVIVAGTVSLPTSGGETYVAMRVGVNGQVDTTFGTDGLAEYPVDAATPAGDRISKVVAVFVQPDGQILLAGSSPSGFSAVRLNPDGTLDATFGQGGTATVPVIDGQSDEVTATAATIQPDGRLVLAGDLPTFDAANGHAQGLVALVRLNLDGSPDATYGAADSGVVLIPPDPSDASSPGQDSADAVAVQPATGDVLVSGSDSYPGKPTFRTLYRLDADGTLDASFGDGGLVTPELPGGAGDGGLAVQADGEILLTDSVDQGGPSLDFLLIARLDPDGSPDPLFGNTSVPGLALTRLTQDAGLAPAIQPGSGDILLAGVQAIPSISGPTYGFAVEGLLPSAIIGPNARPVPPPPSSDLTNLGYSNPAVYDPAGGHFVHGSAIDAVDSAADPNSQGPAFGPAGLGKTIPALADYQGLGYDQYAAYLPSAGVYAILPTATSPGLLLNFGPAGPGRTIPVPADYEGSGKADVAVYLPAQADFAILPADGTAGRIVPFGIPGIGQSIPSPADYYNTGQDDIAVYLEQCGAFAIQDPTGRTPGGFIPFGKPGLGETVPVPGDYDGSGRTEIAVYVPSVGAYFYRPADGSAGVVVPIGRPDAGELAVPGDYDGSGRTEVAIYDPKGGDIQYLPARGGPPVTILIGTPDDGSIPPATPAGSLPEYAASGSGSNAAIRPPATAPPLGDPRPAGTPAMPAAPSFTARPVPAPSHLTSIRLSLARVNQAAPGPDQSHP